MVFPLKFVVKFFLFVRSFTPAWGNSWCMKENGSYLNAKLLKM